MVLNCEDRVLLGFQSRDKFFAGCGGRDGGQRPEVFERSAGVVVFGVKREGMVEVYNAFSILEVVSDVVGNAVVEIASV